MAYYAHQLAVVEDGCEIGEGTRIWHFAHIRKQCRIGNGCNLGKGVFVDIGVKIGSNVKIQNNVSVYHGVEIGDGVFVGPHVCFTNDKLPRAVKPDMSTRSETEWTLATTKVEDGVAIGANATVVAGITLGKWCMVGAGSVVSRSVPPHGLVIGNPARLRGVVTAGGEIVSREYKPGVYWTKDKSEKVEIKAEWMPKA